MEMGEPNFLTIEGTTNTKVVAVVADTVIVQSKYPRPVKHQRERNLVPDTRDPARLVVDVHKEAGGLVSLDSLQCSPELEPRRFASIVDPYHLIPGDPRLGHRDHGTSSSYALRVKVLPRHAAPRYSLNPFDSPEPAFLDWFSLTYHAGVRCQAPNTTKPALLRARPREC